MKIKVQPTSTPNSQYNKKPKPKMKIFQKQTLTKKNSNGISLWLKNANTQMKTREKEA
jgi:hypothetical protein